MKILRRIDGNGNFIEDVVIEPTLDEEGNETYDITDDLIEETVPDGLHLPKWSGTEWIEGDMEASTTSKKQGRYSRLQSIFAKKANGLKKIAINKPYMTEDKAIDEQYISYDALYQQALKGLFDDATNQAIITANESAKAKVAEVNLMLNAIRSMIEKMIETDDDRADLMLDAAEEINAEDITPELIEQIKTRFGV